MVSMACAKAASRSEIVTAAPSSRPTSEIRMAVISGTETGDMQLGKRERLKCFSIPLYEPFKHKFLCKQAPASHCGHTVL